MSLSKENKYPEIRFKGFTDDWEQRKLSDYKDVRDGTHDSPKYYKSGHPLVTSKNLKSSGLDMSNISLISTDDFETINKRSKVDKGDILFGMIGTIGNPVIIDRDDFAIKNVALIKDGGNITNRFLIQLFKSAVFDKYIRNENVGNTQKFIGLNKIRNFKFLVPIAEEQYKIGLFLNLLDKTIALHQEKLDKLHKLKKGYLQVMFPQKDVLIPKVRFTEFKNDWRERKINDISTKTFGGGTPKTSITEYWNGSIPWIQSSDLTEHNLSNVNVRKYISETGLAKSAAKMVPNNSIAIVTRVGVGKLSLVPFYYATSQDFLSLSNLNVDIWFGVYLLYNKLQKELNSVQGTSIKGITKKELLNKEIMVPMKIEEQIKIGNFFKKIDSIILYQQNKLNNLQGIKKSYLQKMFV